MAHFFCRLTEIAVGGVIMWAEFYAGWGGDGGSGPGGSGFRGVEPVGGGGCLMLLNMFADGVIIL